MTQKSKDHDSTIVDIRHTRQYIAEQFGRYLAAIGEDAKKAHATSRHVIWRPKAESPAASPNSCRYD